MVDAATHRRINPNYPVSMVRPKEHDGLSDDSDNSDACCHDSSDDDDDGDGNGGELIEDSSSEPVRAVNIKIKDSRGNTHTMRIARKSVRDAEESLKDKDNKLESNDSETVDGESSDKSKALLEFSEEEYLTASPVVLGFAFAEKMWLEFTVSGIKDIVWNDQAYESLVLEAKTKDIVKVSNRSSHSFDIWFRLRSLY